jgi:hypothetical protein
MRLAILLAESALIISVCYGQSESLPVGGKQFRLGMTKEEALRLAPAQPEISKSIKLLYSVDSALDGRTFFLFIGEAPIGSLELNNGHVSCVRSDEATFTDNRHVLDFAIAMLPFLKRISNGASTPVTLSVTTRNYSGLTIETARISKPPYEYELAWLHPGLPEGTLTLSTALGSCDHVKK